MIIMCPYQNTLENFLSGDNKNPKNSDDNNITPSSENLEPNYEIAKNNIKNLLLIEFENKRKPGHVKRVSNIILSEFSTKHKIQYFGWVQQAYDELKTPRNNETIQKEINKLQTKLYERSKAGRSIGGSAGSFNKAMDNISHQIQLLKQELAKNTKVQFQRGDKVIAKKDSGWHINFTGEVWLVEYREYQAAWYIQLRNPKKWVKADYFEPLLQKELIQDENILSIIIELDSIHPINNKQILNFQINKNHELVQGKDHLFSYLNISDIEQEFIKFGYLVTILEHKELKKNSISDLKLTLQKKIQNKIIKLDPKIINLSDEDLKAKLWKFFLAKHKIEGWMNGKILVVPEGVLNVIDRNLSSNIHAKLDELTREEMLTLYTYRQQQKKYRTLKNKQAKEQALEKQPELTERIEILLSNLKYKTKESQYKPLIAKGIEELPDLPDSSYRYYIFPIATYEPIKHALTKNNVYDWIYHNIHFYEKNQNKLVIILARTKEIADKFNTDLWTKQYGVYEVGKENRHIHDILKKEFYARFRVEDLCWTVRLIPNGKYHLKLIERMKEFDLEVIEITPFTTEEKEAQKQEFLGDILATKRHNWRNIRLSNAEEKQED